MEEEHWKAVLRKPLPLKKGGKIETTTGLAYEAALRALLEQQPALFRDLLAIANSQVGSVSEEAVKQLKEEFLLRRDGSIHPDLRSVLLSSYRETPEGPCIVSPFNPTHDEARAGQRAMRKADRNLLKLLFRDDEGKGR